VDMPAREEDRLGHPIDDSLLLALEPSHPLAGHPALGHQVVEPLRGDPTAITPVLLPDVERVTERDIATLQQPNIKIHVPFDGAEAVVADEDERRIWGKGRLDF